MFEIGDVIILKNIIFEDNYYDVKKVVDHSAFTGRPCLIIGFDEENYYFLPIRRYNKDDNLKQRKAVIEKDASNNFKYDRVSIDMKKIYRRSICFHTKVSEISLNDYLLVIRKLISYNQKVMKDEFFDILLPIFNKQLKELDKSGKSY